MSQGKCACVVNFLIAALAAVSRVAGYAHELNTFKWRQLLRSDAQTSCPSVLKALPRHWCQHRFTPSFTGLQRISRLQPSSLQLGKIHATSWDCHRVLVSTSRSLASSRIAFWVAKVVCATFAKCLCFCCSLPVLLFIIIDIAMQPAVPSDLLVPEGEAILWSLITCVVLLLGRQLLLLPGWSDMIGHLDLGLPIVFFFKIFIHLWIIWICNMLVNMYINVFFWKQLQRNRSTTEANGR